MMYILCVCVCSCVCVFSAFFCFSLVYCLSIYLCSNKNDFLNPIKNFYLFFFFFLFLIVSFTFYFSPVFFFFSIFLSFYSPLSTGKKLELFSFFFTFLSFFFSFWVMYLPFNKKEKTPFFPHHILEIFDDHFFVCFLYSYP